MADVKGFTTIEVARLCRVSDATVKRWGEAGLLKSERTSGGHRRFRAEEAARFQREQGIGLKQSHGDESVVKTTNRARDKKNLSDSAFLRTLIDGGEEARQTRYACQQRRADRFAGRSRTAAANFD